MHLVHACAPQQQCLHAGQAVAMQVAWRMVCTGSDKHDVVAVMTLHGVGTQTREQWEAFCGYHAVTALFEAMHPSV